MALERFRKPLPLAAMFLAASPALLIVALLGYALQARVQLGHWPSYNNPDPKNLGWPIQHVALQFGLAGFPLAVMAAVILAIVGRAQSREFPALSVIFTAIVCGALLLVYNRMDPGGFLGWFWD